MAIRPLRIRTTKEDVKNFKKRLKQVKFQNNINKSTRLKLTKYFLISFTTIGFVILIMKQIFLRLTKTNTKDEFLDHKKESIYFANKEANTMINSVFKK